MTETKWTKGPWNLVWWGNEQYPYPLSILADGDGAWIARDGTVSSVANAHLIAAAPDLYAALDGLIAPGDGGVFATRNLIDAAKAALAKARGEAQ